MTLTVAALPSEPVLPEEPKTATSLCLRYYSARARLKSAQNPPLFVANIDSLLLAVHYNSNQGPRVHESEEFAQPGTQKLQEMSGKKRLSALLGTLLKMFGEKRMWSTTGNVEGRRNCGKWVPVKFWFVLKSWFMVLLLPDF